MPAANKKILIIEDDAFSLKLYSSYLEKEGYKVIATPRAEEVVRLAETERPDLFIVDIMLQGEDGFEVIKGIRKTKGFEKKPIVVLSNLGQELDIKEAMKNGANKYFVKSNVRFQEVMDEVGKLI